ncbi:SDR family NAD(P)-dependent oxidoreductase [Paenibacillus sp. H1-7]|uniref:SDR family NAD(P)-dependent oxidoreductase n=1 Tax=Paenibacillus sp. H1-7 TaxID=2282849 RepID=UPI001EF86CA0|nr:SDR family NAD(P)-dependent oxidoreductase [Paenibacillus sp. H1-7]ULL16529.1 SDR family NAD(P)-dependent oxidoreductase [Paenibacillus sp. H1-7]
MSGNKKVWFIPDAARGKGVELTKANLAEGNQVVATSCNTDKLATILGDHENLLIVKLDITDPTNAEAAVKLAVDRFGRIDVLVNNAGSFYDGSFEEQTLEQIERQFSITLFGPMNVTRAVLPVMRKQRSGHVISISSLVGLVGFEYNVAYASSRLGLEGWMEALHFALAPYSIKTTIVEPSCFTFWAELSIDDYAERNPQFRAFIKEKNEGHECAPAKLVTALVTISNLREPPFRWIANTDAIAGAEQKEDELQQGVNAYPGRKLMSFFARIRKMVRRYTRIVQTRLLFPFF